MIAKQAYALLMAHANGKEPVRGRTRFQKMMFLLWKGMRVRGGGPFGLGFVPHHYGPYSRQLQDDMEGLIGEEVVESPAGQYAYRYRVTERGSPWRRPCWVTQGTRGTGSAAGRTRRSAA